MSIIYIIYISALSFQPGNSTCRRFLQWKSADIRGEPVSPPKIRHFIQEMDIFYPEKKNYPRIFNFPGRILRSQIGLIFLYSLLFCRNSHISESPAEESLLKDMSICQICQIMETVAIIILISARKISSNQPKWKEPKFSFYIFHFFVKYVI